MWGWVLNIVRPVVGWFFKMFGAQLVASFVQKINEYFERKKREAETQKRFEDARDETKKAQTPEEIQRAAENSARNTP